MTSHQKRTTESRERNDWKGVFRRLPNSVWGQCRLQTGWDMV